ncbi:hypothetical protein [Rubidibacter lacunae]|nr:hypothetical protein [Rubidibacter lacunae]
MSLSAVALDVGTRAALGVAIACELVLSGKLAIGQAGNCFGQNVNNTK